MGRSVVRATGVPRPAKPAQQTGYAHDIEPRLYSDENSRTPAL